MLTAAVYVYGCVRLWYLACAGSMPCCANVNVQHRSHDAVVQIQC